MSGTSGRNQILEGRMPLAPLSVRGFKASQAQCQEPGAGATRIQFLLFHTQKNVDEPQVHFAAGGSQAPKAAGGLIPFT